MKRSWKELPEAEKEKRRVYERAWYRRNRAKKLAQARAWQRANRKRAWVRKQAWRKAHPEKVKAYAHKAYSKNRASHQALVRAWRKAHPECVTAIDRRRRAREVGAIGSFTAAEWKALCRKYKHRCLCCGKRRKLTADHVLPLVKGGSNFISNIQPLCGPCNSRKGTKHTDYRHEY